MKIAPDYADVVASEELHDRLWPFGLRSVLSTIFPHNHVAEAFRDTGHIEEFMTFDNVWDIRAWNVPKSTARLLQPELVRDHYLQLIQSYRSVLEEARPILDHTTSKIIQTAGHKPLANLYDCVAVEEVDASPSGGKQTGRRWGYAFSPFVLATAILNEFEAMVIDMCKLRLADINKIATMARTAHSTEQGSNFRLIESALSWRGPVSPSSIERDEQHKVHPLVTRHQQAVESSDIWLQFDEKHFAVAGATISSAGLFKTEHRLRYDMLWHRIMLRRAVSDCLAKRGRVVINGVTYQKTTVLAEGEPYGYYAVEGRTFQEIANLFGKPIKQPDDTVVEPETWAREEVELVAAFVEHHDTEATEALLQRYDLDTSYGNPTRQKMLKQLEYSCTQ